MRLTRNSGAPIIRTTSQPQRNVTRYLNRVYADRVRGPAGMLLGIRRHFISPAMRGREVSACYWALPCPDNGSQRDYARPSGLLQHGDMRARITGIAKSLIGRKHAAPPPPGSPNERIVVPPGDLAAQVVALTQIHP